MSGDYLDLIRLGGSRVGVAVGDVAGKGLPAALLMSNLQAAVRSLAPDAAAPRHLISRVNHVVSANMPSCKFITLFYGVLEGHTLTYTNAGHNAPILMRANGRVERLDCGGVVLGVFPNWAYEETQVNLYPGDRLLLFSDGITEAEDGAGEPFGEDRLQWLARKNASLDAAQLRGRIMSEVSEFAGESFQDDATLLVLAVN
jgi:sigma-B regulation protein RsbU (phosphoserine phosphatase)